MLLKRANSGLKIIILQCIRMSRGYIRPYSNWKTMEPTKEICCTNVTHQWNPMNRSNNSILISHYNIFRTKTNGSSMGSRCKGRIKRNGFLSKYISINNKHSLIKFAALHSRLIYLFIGIWFYGNTKRKWC